MIFEIINRFTPCRIKRKPEIQESYYSEAKSLLRPENLLFLFNLSHLLCLRQCKQVVSTEDGESREEPRSRKMFDLALPFLKQLL